jgi:hypothetical protein
MMKAWKKALKLGVKKFFNICMKENKIYFFPSFPIILVCVVVIILNLIRKLKENNVSIINILLLFICFSLLSFYRIVIILKINVNSVNLFIKK